MSQVTTKFTAETKIARCTDDESSRYTLGAVHVCPTANPGKVWLTATDGRVLAAVVADGETNKPVLCPGKIIPAPTKKRGKMPETALNGRWEANGKIAEVQDGRFPKCGDIVTQVACTSHLRLALDGELLDNLRAALNSENRGLTLFIPLPEASAPAREQYVTRGIPVLGDNGVGCIMPLSCSDNGAEYGRYNKLANNYSKEFQVGT